MKKLGALITVAITILTACGGGGGGSSDNSSVQPVVTVDPIDKYVGTWKTSCSALGVTGIVQSADGLPTRTIFGLKNSKLNATAVNSEMTIYAYANNDEKCANAPIGMLVKSGLNTGGESSSNVTSTYTGNYGTNGLTYDGSTTLATGQKVDKLTIVESKVGITSNANYTVGKIKFNASDFPGGTFKSIAYFADDNTLTINTSSMAYPTVLDSTSNTIFTKQAN
jgi:hypothetical protein